MNDKEKIYAGLVRYERSGAGRHHHRGKSSEAVIDREAVLAVLGVQDGWTVLDAGCGNGYMAREFARRVGEGGRVYALDPDEEAIAALRAGPAGEGITALVGDITAQTPLPAGVFDLIYLSTVVHGFSPEQLRGFDREVRRLLAPGGVLAIVEIVKGETPFGPPRQLRFSPEELKRALTLPAGDTRPAGEYFYLQLFRKSRGDDT